MTKLLHTALAVSALFGLAGTASAQFAGDYAPSKWTVSHKGIDDGSVDVSAAPAAITLIGSNNGSDLPSTVFYTVTVAQSGFIGFDWSFASNDSSGAEYDWAGYVLKGGESTVVSLFGGSVQAGHETVAVSQGDSFGFFVYTDDNVLGEASFTVSGFTAAVPEPASLLLMAMGVAGLVGWSRRTAAR